MPGYCRARRRRPLSLLTLCALALCAIPALPACLAHLSVGSRAAHLGIDWREDFEAARSDAQQTGRPLLVVAVAGEIDGRC